MSKKVKLILILVVFAAVLGGAAVLYNNLKDKVDTEQLATEEDSSTEEEGTTEEQKSSKIEAPDFTVYDKDGKEIHLTDYLGKPIVLNFWASWCGPCKMEMPDFDEKYKEMGEKVQFLMVNMTSGRETREDADAFLAEQGFSFPILYDTEGSAAEAYSAYSLPTTYFIDEDGHVIARATGMIDAETLEKGISMICPENEE